MNKRSYRSMPPDDAVGRRDFLKAGGAIGAGLIMTGRFVRVLNEFEQLYDQLEERVEAKQDELRASHARMRQLETEQAVAEERERIYRDLHDDMGAKLLGLAISAQRANLHKEADLARSALQDLRDVVSRDMHVATPLADLLADWRIETEQRVRNAGLALEWTFPDHDITLEVHPEGVLNLTRILREAVTNVLRHAQASRVWVSLARENGALELTVSDDGQGFELPGRPDVLTQAGHFGLVGMRERALLAGGEMSISSSPEQGTTITVRVPE